MISQERINRLLFSSIAGSDYFSSLEDERDQSNCHGTSFYLLGIYDNQRPVYLNAGKAKAFIDTFFDDADSIENNLVAFWSGDYQLMHTAVGINKTEVIDQSGVGQSFTQRSFEEVKNDYPYTFSFHSLKEPVSLPVVKNTLRKKGVLDVLLGR
ncbi:MAG: hypothetical protein KC535_02840 [Nanoarchaeota archaeon]|nr:hypothetical protein [Nanoarchaeota archaeon]